MANALHDNNRITSALAVLNTDTVQGTNLVTIKIVESTNGMMVSTTDTISFTMEAIGEKDANYVDVLMWEGTDGLSYPGVANSSGEVLIEE